MAVPILFEADYPLYAVRARGSEVIVCGGGGTAKTGVPNGLDIYELAEESTTHLGSFRGLKGAAMSLDARSMGNILAVGVDGTTSIVSHSRSASKAKGKRSDASETSVTAAAAATADTASAAQPLDFAVDGTVETDHSKEPFQACIRFSKKGNLFCTGGADGCVRVWSFPELQEQFVATVHKANVEVDDADLDAAGRLIAVCGAQAKVYDTQGKAQPKKAAGDGAEAVMLTWASRGLFASGKNQVFKFCRFIATSAGQRLVTVMVPPGAERGLAQCHLVLWDAGSLQPLRSTATGTAVTSTFAVSDDGALLGLGDNEGYVSVYDVATLKCLVRRQTHELFVTSVAFHGRSLLSVSVDHYCIRTPIPAPGALQQLSPTLLLILIALFLLLVTVVLPLLLA